VGGLGIPKREASSSELLGSPLHSDNIDTTLTKRVRRVLDRFVERISSLSSHEGLYLFLNSLAIPKLMFLLRTSPSYKSNVCAILDDTLSQALSTITNCSLSDAAWSRASLLIRWGGVGLCKVSELAASAFLASTHSVKEWTDLLLPSSIKATLEDEIDQVRLHWISIAPGLTHPLSFFTQRAWDEPVCKMRFTSLPR